MEDTRFKEIITQIKAGHQAAMDALLVDCFDLLRSTIAQQMSDTLKKAQLEPEDVIQEVYTAAWSHLSETDFDSFEAFTSWLRQIAENKLIDMHRAILADKRDIRKQAPSGSAQTGTYIGLLDQVISPLATPSRGAARSEALAVMMVRMQQLPEDYRQVIHWRLIDGLPVAEVARRLDRSEAAIHMLCHRALKQLRDLMGAPSDYLTQR